MAQLTRSVMASSSSVALLGKVHRSHLDKAWIEVERLARTVIITTSTVPIGSYGDYGLKSMSGFGGL